MKLHFEKNNLLVQGLWCDPVWCPITYRISMAKVIHGPEFELHVNTINWFPSQMVSNTDIWCSPCYLPESTLVIPPEQRSCWGVYWFHSVRPSIRPSVRPSVCPSVRPACRVRSVTSTVLDGFFPYLAQMITNMRGCIAYNDLWPWPISSRSFGLDLENRVRSIASTVLDGFFPYLIQMITSMRRCVACDDLWPWPISSRSFDLVPIGLRHHDAHMTQ